MPIEGGYFRAPNNVFKVGLNPNEIAVYLYIVRCYNNNEYAFPSFKTIAANCGMSPSSAFRTVKNLEEMKLIRKTRRVYESNIYVPSLDIKNQGYSHKDYRV